MPDLVEVVVTCLNDFIMASKTDLDPVNGENDRMIRENGNGIVNDKVKSESEWDGNKQNGRSTSSPGTAVPENWTPAKKPATETQETPKPSMMKKVIDKLGLDVGTVLMMFK